MHLATLILGCLILVAGCNRTEPIQPNIDAVFGENEKAPPNIPQHLLDAYHHYAKETASTFLSETSSLRLHVERFLDNPTIKTKTALQTQWLNTHIAYSSAQFGIMAPDNEQLHFQIDAWPIQPGFIDNLPQYPYSGVVFDKTVAISATSLLDQHGITDSEEVILGFHSLELLIFSRPIEDFESDQNEWNDRRRKMLSLMSEQLDQDAQTLVQLSTQYHEDNAQDPMIIRTFFENTQKKVRLAFQESHLVAAQNAGHCLTNKRSVAVLAAEINALNEFLLEAVPLGSVLKDVDPTTFDNFVKTIKGSQEAIQLSPQDEVTRAKLPLLLLALTHQIESFHRAI